MTGAMGYAATGAPLLAGHLHSGVAAPLCCDALIRTRNRKGREDGATRSGPAFRALFAEFAATLVPPAAPAHGVGVLDPWRLP